MNDRFAREIVAAACSLSIAALIAGCQSRPAQPAQTAQPEPAQAPPTVQRAAGQDALLAEKVFKNVQVLKGIPVGEFMDTMAFFSAAVGSNCVHCHVDESLNDWTKFAEDVPRKRRARQMIVMMNAINSNTFGGAQAVSCYSCHHGDIRPDVVPSLQAQYSLPVEDPNKVEIVPGVPTDPSADQILDKYVQALGGPDRLARVTSFMGTGTDKGYDTYEQKVPFEIFAKAPDQRTAIVHTQNGITTATFNGDSGWLAAVDKPVTLLPLNTGGELDGAKLDADLSFPAGVKRALTDWRVGFPLTSIGDRDVQIVQGTGAGGTRVKLYFEVKSGLLTRVVRYTKTIVGTVPTQIDYANYRDVSGVKMPFKWVITWTGGLSTIELTAVQPNVPIDSAKFTKPAPAIVKRGVQ